MIKFVYIASLSITSFLLFIFSKDKEDIECNNIARGKVEIIQDSSRSFLCVKTDENKIFYPSSMANEVVLAVGQKVVICYAVDSSLYKSEAHPIPVYIGSVSYLNK